MPWAKCQVSGVLVKCLGMLPLGHTWEECEVEGLGCWGW